jgi:hypothetical protein
MLKRRDQLFAHALRPYIAARLVGDTIRDVANDLASHISTPVSRDAIFESVRVLAGTTLTHRDAKDLAWRLAGNTPDPYVPPATPAETMAEAKAIASDTKRRASGSSRIRSARIPGTVRAPRGASGI